MKSKVTAAAAILALLAPVLAAGQQALPKVKVMQQSSVRGAAITIGDIGSVEAADARTAQVLSKLRLGMSPMPGSWREMERDLITAQLARNGFGPSRVKLICPPLVRIYRESQTVSRQLLKSRLRDFASSNAPWDPDEMEITNVGGLADIVVPAGELEINIKPRGTSSYLGPVPFSVEIDVDGNNAASLVMQANISVFRDAVVTTTAITAHSLIEPSDVEIRRVDISASRGKCYSSLEKVVGKATTTYLQAGAIVTAKTLTAPLLVRRGDVVQLIASKPGFTIRTSGVAQQDGRRGEVISVMNTSTRKIIEAKVTGPQRAAVLF